MIARINQKLLDGLKATGQRFYIWCDKEQGLGLEIQANGKHTWIHKYSIQGKQRKLRLGGMEMTLQGAVALVRQQQTDIAKGIDPKAPVVPPEKTFGVWLKSWLEKTTKLRETTRTSWLGVARRHITPRMGALGIGEVNEIHIKKLMDDLSHIQSQANTARAILSVALVEAAALGLRPRGNPTDYIDPYPTRERQTYIRPNDMSRALQAVQDSDASDATKDALYPAFADAAKASGYLIKDAIAECDRLFGTIVKKTQGSVKLTPEAIAHNRDIRDLARILADLEPNTSPEGLLSRLQVLVHEVGPEAVKYLADKPRREGWLLLRSK